MSEGGTWLTSVKSGTETMGEGRKGVLIGQLGRKAASGPRKEGGKQTIGALLTKKEPLGGS